MTSGSGDAGRESPFALGAGARGMAMGRAFVALSGDASATFWNPAATSTIDRSEIMAFHTSLFLDTKYDCLGISYPLYGIGVFSLSAGRLGSDGMERRDENNLSTGTFSSAESQFGLSYAREIAFGISTGITVKAANLRIDNLSGTGFGADLGFQYRPHFVDGLIVGAGFNDIVKPGIKLESVEDKYQTLSRLGLSYTRRFKQNVSSTAGLDLAMSPGRDVGLHTGIELSFYERFALRAGLDRGRLSFGAGMIYNFVKLDYAYENVEYLGSSHRISFGFAFGKSVTRRRDEARARIAAEERENWLNDLASERRGESVLMMTTADSLKDSGRYQEALGYYQRALVLDSTSQRAGIMSDSMVVLVMAQAIAASGDEKRQELISGRIESAVADFRNGLYKESISKLQLLLEIDPGNESVSDLLSTVRETLQKEIQDRARMARSYGDAGDYINAIAEWNRLLALESDNAEALAQITEIKNRMEVNNLIAEAVAAMRQNRYADAVNILNRARKLRPDDRTVGSLILEARSKSAPPTSLDDIKSSPNDWDKYLSGLENYQSGDYSAALSIWEELRDSYPNNAELDNNIDQARQRLAAEGGRR